MSELNIDNINFDSNVSLSEVVSSVSSTLNGKMSSNEKSIQSKMTRTTIKEKCVKSKCINDKYFWEPMDESWQSKLGSSHFMIKNCLGDGNCQFRSIETALTNAGYKTTHEKLRKKLVKYISSVDNKFFIDIIKTYQIEKESGEFVGNWDPMAIKSKRDFLKVLKTPGFDFQGDFITLELLSRAIGIDIIIFTGIDRDIINLSDPDHLQSKILILFYEKSGDNGHYQTIGLKSKSGSVQTIFTRSKLQPEISRILDKHSFLSFHVKDICESGMCGASRIHLNYIMNTLESRLGVKISRNDRLIIIKLITHFLEKSVQKDQDIIIYLTLQA